MVCFHLPAGQANLTVLNRARRPIRSKIYRQATGEDGGHREENRKTCSTFRLLRDQCELAQVVIIERTLSVGGLSQSECSGDFDFERTGVDKAVDLL